MFDTNKKEVNDMKPVLKKYILEISNGNRFLLSGDKYLVGNLESADIELEIAGVVGPIILLVRDADSFDLVCLNAELEITVNNKLISGVEKDIVGKKIVCEGVELTVKSSERTNVEARKLATLPAGLPSLPNIPGSSTFIEEAGVAKSDAKKHSDLQLVDDEYCNIVFHDEYVEKLNHHPFDLKNKIDYPDELINKDVKLDEEKSKRLYIEIVVMTRGRIVFIDQVEYKTGLYDLSWGVEAKTPLIVFKDDKVEILTPTGFDKEVIEHKKSGSSALDQKYLEGKIYSLFNSPTQIFIREVVSSKKAKPYLFFEAEKEVLKEVGKVAAALFIPFLLLLFIDTSLPVKKKEDVAIIYKRLKMPKKPKPKVAKVVQKVEKNNAQKDSKANDQAKAEKKTAKLATPKVSVQMKSEPNKAKTPKVTLKNRASAKRVVKSPISTHKTNKTTRSKVNKVAKKAPVKTYKLNMKSKFKNLFGNQKSASSLKVSKRGATANFAGGDNAKSNRLTGLNSRVGSGKSVGSIGGSVSGQASGAYGTSGLGGKKGYYATLSRKRTVVMGSMDPELIRRLLREHLSQFRYCYQKEIVNNQAASSMTADLKFTIMPGGGVANVNLIHNNKSFSTKGKACLRSVLHLIDFPSPKGGGRVDIQQPLSFTFSKRNI